jgi:hypothetical protein
MLIKTPRAIEKVVEWGKAYSTYSIVQIPENLMLLMCLHCGGQPTGTSGSVASDAGVI